MASLDEAMKKIFNILENPEGAHSKDGLTLGDDNVLKREGTVYVDGMDDIVRWTVGRYAPKSILKRGVHSLSFETKAQDFEVNTEIRNMDDVKGLSETVSHLLNGYRVIKGFLIEKEDVLNKFIEVVDSLPRARNIYDFYVNLVIETRESWSGGDTWFAYMTKEGTVEIHHNSYKQISPFIETLEVVSQPDSMPSVTPLLDYHTERFQEASDYLSEALQA